MYDLFFMINKLFLNWVCNMVLLVIRLVNKVVSKRNSGATYIKFKTKNVCNYIYMPKGSMSKLCLDASSCLNFVLTGDPVYIRLPIHPCPLRFWPLLLRSQVSKGWCRQGSSVRTPTHDVSKGWCLPKSGGKLWNLEHFLKQVGSSVQPWPTSVLMKRALLLQGQILSLQGFRSVQVSSCLITINPYQTNCFFRPLRDTGWSSQWWWIGLRCHQPGNAPALIRWVRSCVFGMI